jgi:hypothetical protein
MIRTLSLVALVAAGFTGPAFAAEIAADKPDAHAQATYQAYLNGKAAADQARKILVSRGYINVSELNRTDNGHWVGTAFKDGKQVPVSVVLPPKNPADTATN